MGDVVGRSVEKVARRVLWLGILLTACSGETARLEFQIVTPEGEDPFEGVAELVVRAADQEETATVSDGHVEVSFKVPFGTKTRLVLEGRDEAGRLVSSGRSPTFYAVASARALGIWFSRVGQVTPFPWNMPAGVAEPALATYVRPVWDSLDHEPFYTFWFGGCDGAGRPVDTAGYFDPYYLFVAELPSMFDSTYWSIQDRPVGPTCGGVAGSVGDGNFFFFGGVDLEGRPTDQFVLLLAQEGGFSYLRMGLECEDRVDNDGDGATDLQDEDCASGLDLTEGPDRDYALAHARLGMLGPYASLWDGTDWRVATSGLVVGGVGPDGPSRLALHVLVEKAASGTGYRLRIEPLELAAARTNHCVATAASREGDVETRAVLVFGGAQGDGPAAELFSFELDAASPSLDWAWHHEEWTEDLDGQPLPNLDAAACVGLGGGRILVCGGRDEQGRATADCWVYGLGSGGLKRLPGLLGTVRSDAALVRGPGDLVVLAGGSGGSGEPADTALVLSVPESGDATLVRQVDFPGPSRGLAGFTWANGQPVFLGGITRDGVLSDGIFIANFQPESGASW